MTSTTTCFLNIEEWKAPFEIDDDGDDMEVVLEFTETVSDEKVLEILVCSVEDNTLPLGIERSKAPAAILVATVNGLPKYQTVKLMKRKESGRLTLRPMSKGILPPQWQG